LGSTSIAPTVATDASRAFAHVKDEAGCVDQRVGAHVHRRRAGVVGAAEEGPATARLARDRRDDAERLAQALEHRPLLDVHLEVRVR
jgi:hypothetical protein